MEQTTGKHPAARPGVGLDDVDVTSAVKQHDINGGAMNRNQSNSASQNQDSLVADAGDVMDDDDDVIEAPRPPDGGWGWMVVLGSFIVHIIADGMAYSFGVVVVALLDHFEDAGREEMGFIGAIMVGLTMGVGPIASILESKFGCRVVTILGTFVCAFGFFISIWAPSVQFMYISFGVIGGTGFGLIYLPAITCVSYYFEKKRAFATGLAVCGSGLGTFIFAPVIDYLLSEYGWRGTVMIQSALLLNCCVSGMLFRPLKATPKSRRRAAAARKKVAKSESTKPLLLASKARDDELTNELNAFKETQLDKLKNSDSGGGGGVSRSLHDVSNADEFGSNSSSKQRHNSEAHLYKRRQPSGHASHKHADSHIHHHTPHVASRLDQFYTGSLERIPQYRQDPQHYTASVTRLDTQTDDDLPRLTGHVTTAEDVNPYPCCTCFSLEKRRSLKKTFDLSLFKDIFFEMFAWSNFLTNFTFFIPFLFLPDRAVTLGESERNGALLVSVIGIFNTAGRIIFGFVSDRIDNRLYLYNTSLAMCGLVTCLSAHFPAYPYLAAYAASYGLLVGVYVTLTPVIIVDLLGIEKLSNAFGWVLGFQGIATALGPPIAGMCYDKFGDYVFALWLFGAMMFMSGVMLYPIPCIGRALNKPWKPSQAQAHTNVDTGEAQREMTHTPSASHA